MGNVPAGNFWSVTLNRIDQPEEICEEHHWYPSSISNYSARRTGRVLCYNFLGSVFLSPGTYNMDMFGTRQLKVLSKKQVHGLFQTWLVLLDLFDSLWRFFGESHLHAKCLSGFRLGVAYWLFLADIRYSCFRWYPIISVPPLPTDIRYLQKADILAFPIIYRISNMPALLYCHDPPLAFVFLAYV